MEALKSLQQSMANGSMQFLAGALSAVRFLRRIVSQDLVFQRITRAEDEEIASAVASGALPRAR